MSNAYGRVHCKDGRVYYFEYQGSSDFTRPMLFETIRDLENAWRSNYDVMIDPSTAEGVEGVIIETEYGGGFWFEGAVCRFTPILVNLENDEGVPVTVQVCGLITHGLSPEDRYVNDGLFKHWDEFSEHAVTGTGDIEAELKDYTPSTDDMAWLAPARTPLMKSCKVMLSRDDM